MKKLRYGAMTVAIVAGVGAFLGAQRLALIPGPWSEKGGYPTYVSDAAGNLSLSSSTAGPVDYMAYYRRGVEYQFRGQYEQALADLNQAVELSPTPLSLDVLGVRAMDSRSRDTHTLGMVFLIRTTRADTLLRLNRPAEALSDLDAAIALDPRKTEAFYARGLLRTKTGLYDAAIADFDALLARRDHINWYFARGLAKYFKGDWTDAALDFSRASRLAPHDNTFLIWLAKSHLRAGTPLHGEPFANMDRRGSAWAVVQALMSDHNPEQFFSGVVAGVSYSNTNSTDARCKAALFVGEWLTIRKGGAGAHDMFAEAERTCQPLSIEKAVATAELQRPALTVEP